MTTQPIRVLHALDSMAGGGAQQVVLDLVAWSASAGIATAIVAADGPRRGDIPEGVEFLPAADGSFLAYTRTLFSACRRFRPTVLHAHQRREALASLLVGRALGIPVVEHAHTVLPDTRLKGLSFRTRRIFSVGPAVTRMLTCTFRVSADRIDTIGNLVPGAALAPAADRKPAPGAVIGIGRLEEQKDPLRFSDIVRSGVGRFEGVWYGDGPLRPDVLAHAARTGSPVRFAGRSTSIIAEMDRAAALLLTSRWEGTPSSSSRRSLAACSSSPSTRPG
ncbi:secreted protein [Leifsonia xyli subsp. cynodontis DSM 46306]|jgi:glycosyltransferase involved in cell wall biosynthesis|uniref:Glycosyltransferase subfamily 4-like N-terminal domain-containing protein n=1 Tax=Leifsonia xyli subsp. cynodontis DSM 46306 TaxID=1389489 RepID=U3P5Q7_LEIXC|nr:glycosyltransferase [Leifsonia xyli]AGW40794.1 secreted protein [Leifsonia xyli subsp. cynodontis DSM 46306]